MQTLLDKSKQGYRNSVAPEGQITGKISGKQIPRCHVTSSTGKTKKFYGKITCFTSPDPIGCPDGPFAVSCQHKFTFLASGKCLLVFFSLLLIYFFHIKVSGPCKVLKNFFLSTCDPAVLSFSLQKKRKKNGVQKKSASCYNIFFHSCLLQSKNYVSYKQI